MQELSKRAARFHYAAPLELPTAAFVSYPQESVYSNQFAPAPTHRPTLYPQPFLQSPPSKTYTPSAAASVAPPSPPSRVNQEPYPNPSPLLDSCASHHFLPRRDSFFHLYPSSIPIRLADNYASIARGIDTANLPCAQAFQRSLCPSIP